LILESRIAFVTGFRDSVSHWATQDASAKVGTWKRRLARTKLLWIIAAMSGQEIIEQIKELPPSERAQVARFIVENEDSWIPDEFKEAMKDAEEGRLVDMETALRETPPPHLQ
jgi:hypothetical protein